MSGYTRQTGNESPDMADVILNALRAQQLEINTCMPGEIVAYDSATTTCTVQPAYKRIMVRDNVVTSRAQISDVPVVFPRSGANSITFPITQGDQCLIMFSQRSLDDWLNIGGEVTLRDTRLHDITDAIVIPGLVPRTGALVPPPSADGIEIRSAKILLGDTGTASEPLVLGDVLQTNLEDLISAINDLVALITAGQNIGTGSGTIVSSIITTAVEASLSAVESSLSSQNSAITFGE